MKREFFNLIEMVGFYILTSNGGQKSTKFSRIREERRKFARIRETPFILL